MQISVHHEPERDHPIRLRRKQIDQIGAVSAFIWTAIGLGMVRNLSEALMMFRSAGLAFVPKCGHSVSPIDVPDDLARSGETIKGRHGRLGAGRANQDP